MAARVREVRELSMDDYRHCPGKATYHPKTELLPRSAFRPGCKHCKKCNALDLQRIQRRKSKHGRAQVIQPAVDAIIGDRCLEPRALMCFFGCFGARACHCSSNS
jgi:hypothetical protein